MSTLYLVLSTAGFVAVLNALRPLRGTLVVIPAFFSAWLTVELAPQFLVVTTLEVAAFVALDAVSGLAGALALVLSGLTVLGLLWLVHVSESAADVADLALAGMPDGPTPASDVEVTSWFRRFFVPMSFSHPDVERLVDVPYSDVSARHRLDVYRRRDQPTGCPTLLQVHGGGW
ncbi:MAG: hypothetical protein ABIO67_03065, partial [Mycobacteriales bacterium]